MIPHDVLADGGGSAREAERTALADAERRYRALARCSGAFVLRVAAGGEIIDAAPGAGGFGFTPADVTGRALADLLAPEGASRDESAARIAAVGDEGVLAGTILRADGRREDYEAAVCAVRDDDGRFIERLVAVRSAEAAHRQEEALAEGLAQYTALARHIPGGAVFLFDTDRRYLLAEGAVAADLTYGVAPVGRTPAEVFPPGVSDYVAGLYDRALAGEDHAFRRVATTGRVYDITIGPIRSGGVVIGGMSLLIDVTERAHLELEQAALREISEAVFEGASPDAVFGLVVDRVAAIFGAVGAAIFRFEQTGHAIVLASAPVGPVAFLGDPRVPLDTSTAVGRVAESGRAVFVSEYPDRGLDDPLAEALRRLGAVGGAAAPISIRHRLWGALGIGSASPEQLTEETATRLTRFAELVATHIGNVEAWHALAHDASTDLLTGLPNRRTFTDRLAAEMARARRFDRPLALVLFDIDHFKAVNDTHGHLVGDRVLAALARVVGAEARGEEMIARIGGEEFAMLLPETDARGAVSAAERLRVAVADARLEDVGVTISLGVDDMRAGDGPDDLVVRADQALYRAKAGGRNLTRRWSAGQESAQAP